jgi:hypothetical protein
MQYIQKEAKTLFLCPSEAGRPSHKDKVRVPGSSRPGDPSMKNRDRHYTVEICFNRSTIIKCMKIRHKHQLKLCDLVWTYNISQHSRQFQKILYLYGM